jgi:5-methylcytosine-specific restriction endonuclease McrA
VKKQQSTAKRYHRALSRAGVVLFGDRVPKKAVVIATAARELGLVWPSAAFSEIHVLIRFCEARGLSLDKAATKKKRPTKLRRVIPRDTFTRLAKQYGPPRSAAPEDRTAYLISDEFLRSYEWRRLRMVVLKQFGARCQCCGATSQNGVVIHVDHIKPRRLFPHLALVESNLQVLCEACNHGKGNWDDSDWRPMSRQEVEEALSREFA